MYNSQQLPGISQTSLFSIHKPVPLSHHYLCFTGGEAKPDPSKVFHQCRPVSSWKWVWGPAQQHHAWPQGPVPFFLLLHHPKASSSQEQDSKIAGTVCRAPWILEWGLQRTELKVSLPAALLEEGTLWYLYLPWKYICYHSPSPTTSSASLSLLYSAHTRPRGAFLPPSVRFEIGLSSL